MGREYKKLKCGCFVSEDGGGGLIPCYYPEIGQKESKLHKQCMQEYLDELKKRNKRGE